jgi:hypothetical protein
MAIPEIIQILNQAEFQLQDLMRVLDIIDQNPLTSLTMGSHRRSCIWVCAQPSNCRYRRAVLPPILVEHGADVDGQADNGMTPLLSLYTGKASEHKRQMALVLVHECGATVPYVDKNSIPIDLPSWLNGAPLKFPVL